MSAARNAKFYESTTEVVKDIPNGAKLLVGGKHVFCVHNQTILLSDGTERTLVAPKYI